MASWNFHSFVVTWHPNCKRILLDRSITKTFPGPEFKYIWWKEKISTSLLATANRLSGPNAINCPLSCGPGVTSSKDYGIILTEAKDINLTFVVSFNHKNNFIVFKIDLQDSSETPQNRRNRFENECFARTVALRWVVIPWNGFIPHPSERTSL